MTDIEKVEMARCHREIVQNLRLLSNSHGDYES
jgi:hypothetical protein